MQFNKTLSILVSVLSLAQCYCFGQSKQLDRDLINYSSAVKHAAENFAPEKLYLQLDKPYYTTGDTIWFKTYLLNSFLLPSYKSNVINIDIADDSGRVIKQYRFPVSGGISYGNVSLGPKDGFTGGTYTIRAYTNWMRNFGDGYFFYKTFYVTGNNENGWLVNQQVKQTGANNMDTVSMKLRFGDMDKKLFMLEPLQLSVLSGSKHLYKQKVQTDLSGLTGVNLAVPKKAGNLTLVAESEKYGKKAVIPIALNRTDNMDVQFLPEGGNLVAGLPAHIGFKSVGEDGKGIQVSGIITDHNQQKVAIFQSLHNGMGSFDLDVKPGETYTANITLPNGVVKEFPLPAVKNTGMVLNVKNPMDSDSLTVYASASHDLAEADSSYFLIGKARGIVCYAAVINFRKSNILERKIAKSLFPSGITHFTLMATTYQPLNERLVFIDHGDNLNIKIIVDKPNYSPKDSIALQLNVTDNMGNPIAGNFSMAVTDDAQVKTGSPNGENMISRMLLTSDLRGYVEEPGYYLTSKTAETWQALDNLLLTQGWVGYDWQQVLNPPAFAYQPETGLTVKGSVINVFNKPVKGTNVLLFSKSPSILMDTVTDQNGKFVFDRFPKVDTPVFVLKAVNKNGKSFNVSINVDEIKPPEFIKPARPLIMPWYVNTDTTLVTNATTFALMKQQENFPMGGHILKEVKILAKKIVKGSQNLNGPGEADIVLDEKDLEAAGKKTLLQLLKENIKGFNEGTFIMGASQSAIKEHFLSAYVTDGNPSLQWYFINRKPVKIIVDGISATYDFKSGGGDINGAFSFMSDYLNGHSAEDVKGIEIIRTAGYAGRYLSRYDPGDLLKRAIFFFPPIDISPTDIAFVEITTRGGHGPAISNTPGMYLYKPLPISWPKQFYKPKYAVKDTVKHLPGMRSTIDWEPNVTTGEDGKASFSFYAADKPGTYTIIIEGTDGNGNLGFKIGKVKIGMPDGKAN